MAEIHYRTANVDGFKVFYREAGRSVEPALLLPHGFASASHMFREPIPALSDRFRMIAPDLPGFGQSDMPPRDPILVHLWQIGRSHRAVHRSNRACSLRNLCLRLRCADPASCERLELCEPKISRPA